MKNQKLPFRVIAPRVLELYDAFYTSIGETQVIIYDELYMYLTESGWDTVEFDLELLKIIDGSWELNVN